MEPSGIVAIVEVRDSTWRRQGRWRTTGYVFGSRYGEGRSLGRGGLARRQGQRRGMGGGRTADMDIAKVVDADRRRGGQTGEFHDKAAEAAGKQS